MPGDQPAEGLDEVLARYRQLVPHVELAGPTSFAPLIDTAMRLVIESGMQYHILVSAVSGGLGQRSPVGSSHSTCSGVLVYIGLVTKLWRRFWCSE